VIVIVGDDQHEMFESDLLPSLAVFTGTEIWDLPMTTETLLPSIQQAAWAIHADVPERYPVDADLGAWIAERLSMDDFDPTVVGDQLGGRSLGHAFTFVRRRLLPDRDPACIVPIFLNTYYPPNRPSPERCWRLGVSLGRALSEWPTAKRVAVVASGGLSHFVIDEALDQLVLRALRDGDAAAIAGLTRDQLQSGTSEIMNWIVVGAAMWSCGLKLDSSTYLPLYRTSAGTGVGMGFSTWI
jgi:3-O-methylgallate 3,4-dioxygenase